MTDDQAAHNVVPDLGYVPDAATAIAIARAIWVPIYGAAVLEQEPVSASLVGETWHVTGWKPPSPGGTALAYISKRTGAILRVSHGC